MKNILLELTDSEAILVNHAAKLAGVDIAKFIISAANQQAVKNLTSHGRIVLDNETFQRLTTVLENPEQASDELKQLMMLN